MLLDFRSLATRLRYSPSVRVLALLACREVTGISSDFGPAEALGRDSKGTNSYSLSDADPKRNVPNRNTSSFSLLSPVLFPSCFELASPLFVLALAQFFLRILGYLCPFGPCHRRSSDLARRQCLVPAHWICLRFISGLGRCSDSSHVSGGISSRPLQLPSVTYRPGIFAG